MRPGKNDVAVLYQISGLQLTELQKYTGDMCDAFGLDERIYKYKSTGSYLDITSPASYRSDKGDLPELSIANPPDQRKLIIGQLFLSAWFLNVASGSTATGCVTLLSKGKSLRESL